MSTATYWWGAGFGFCMGVGFVAAFLFVDQRQRRRR
jgi:hypothetical protein